MHYLLKKGAKSAKNGANPALKKGAPVAHHTKLEIQLL